MHPMQLTCIANNNDEANSCKLLMSRTLGGGYYRHLMNSIRTDGVMQINSVIL